MNLNTIGSLRGRKLTLGIQGVTVRCRCGYVITYPNENLGCIECGEPCCPACAFSSEGVVYCPSCAQEKYELAFRINGEKGCGVTYFVPRQDGMRGPSGT